MLHLLPQFAGDVQVTFLSREDNRNVPQPRVRLHQVHGNQTVVLREPSEGTSEADGVITNVPGLTLMVRAADCQNFAVYAPKHGVGGVLHVGWRGVVSEALRGFYEVLGSKFDIEPEETYVVAGPSLCLQCAEYKDPEFELRQRINPRFVHGDNVDLQGAATMQLLDLGVPRDQFVRHSDCTKCHPETYFTYRGGDKSSVESGESNILTLKILRGNA